MKLNLEIDIDWLDEDSSLDDAVKKQIIDGVTTKLQEKIQADVEKQIVEKVELQIGELVEKTYTEFLEKGVSITDGYGDTVKTYDTVEALLKDRFDKFLLEKVDENGKVNGYGPTKERIKHIIDSQLKTFADEFTTEAVKQVSEEIRQHVQDGLTAKLGSELMKVLKVEEMLGLPEAKN